MTLENTPLQRPHSATQHFRLPVVDVYFPSRQHMTDHQKSQSITTFVANKSV